MAIRVLTVMSYSSTGIFFNSISDKVLYMIGRILVLLRSVCITHNIGDNFSYLLSWMMNVFAAQQFFDVPITLVL